MGSNTPRAERKMAAVALATMVALLVAVVFAAGVAEAKGGGGGRGGGGGGGKPTSSSSSKPSSDAAGGGYSGRASADKGLPPGVANPSSPYYNSPKYGTRYHSFSNFWLWSWVWHGRGGDCDQDDVAEGDPDCYYEEEYVAANNDIDGWAVTGLAAAGAGMLFWRLRKRRDGGLFTGEVTRAGHEKETMTAERFGKDASPSGFDTRTRH